MNKKLIFISFFAIVISQKIAFAFVDPFDKSEEKARFFYLEENFEEGLKIYKNFKSAPQDFPLLLNNIAIGKSKLGQKDVQKNFENAIKKLRERPYLNEKKKTQLANIYFNFAHHYFSRGFFQKSIKLYRENLKLFPDDISARHNLELALLRKIKKDNQQNKSKNKQNKNKNTEQEKGKNDPEQKKKNQPKNNNQKKVKKNQQKGKISKARAKEILKNIQQSSTNKNDLRTYREVIHSKQSGKRW